MQVESALPPQVPHPTLARRRRIWLVAILGLSLGLRLFLAWRGGAYYWTDEKRYNASREAIAALVDADWSGVSRFLFSNSEHIGFRFLTLPAAALERLIYADDPPHAKIAAAWLGLFSVCNLALIWKIAGRLSARAWEAEWALTFAAASNALFFFSRHCFPYDAALTFFLLAAYHSVSGRRRSRSFVVGLYCALGYLTYNGYWSVGAVVCALEVCQNCSEVPRWRRTVLVLTGLILPISIIFAVAGLCGFNLVSDSIRFAGTVNQGDFGDGWRFVGEYLWATDGILPIALTAIVIIGSAFTIRQRTVEPWLRWIAAILLLLGIWLFFSDVVHRFVLYGRTVRALIPFLALAAAGALTSLRDSSRTTIQQLLQFIAVIGCLGGSTMMVPPLRQIFPVEFRQLATQTMVTVRAQAPAAEFRVLFDNYQFGPNTGGVLPPHRELLRRPHPHQYRPYLYEGYTRAQRPLYLNSDTAMRLVQLEPDRGLDHFEFSSALRSIAPYPGPLLVRFRLPRHPSGTEWILQHGPAAAPLGVFIRYIGSTGIRVGSVVPGSTPQISEPIAVSDDSEHSLLLSLESLFPPASGAGSSSSVAFDGHVILRNVTGSQPAGISTLRLGGTIQADQTANPFSGELVQVCQLDPSTLEARDSSGISQAIEGAYFGARHGVLELTLRFPEATSGHSEMLLASGIVGRGDQLFVSYLDPHHVRFGIDHWGSAPLLSESISITPGAEQHIIVSFGSFFPPQDDPRYLASHGLRFLQQWLFLSVNDVVLFSQPFDFFGAENDGVTIGRSKIGSSNANLVFTGKIVSAAHRNPEELGLTESKQAWPPIHGQRLANGHLGAMNLTVKFPGRWEVGREPLLVAGIPPNADIVFLRYVGNSHVHLEFRHGTDQPIRSNALVARPGEIHRIGVSLRSLLAQGSQPVEITFDSEKVLTSEKTPYGVPADSVFFGNTPMDTKWLRSRFSGKILHVDLINRALP
jgi:hypothetical protein